ncbi:hypothetical protein TRFO_20857 [Tritrichomonas foetus]|uniref:Transmembrane protein n=1 Tax=Tritrichomonas foetus TaxID=1144522 RepID=A0A1J4KF12_9EUKA|nr:hypothetical protein TRFO_20857 [Tritrichomonas foetus]|eukprot:OHT10049.1 hypothetical protein TRFO_20857 [Tritrichomonas foetus]
MNLRENSVKLQQVELNDSPSENGNFFLDLASITTFKTLGIIYIGFLLIHAFAAFIAPPNSTESTRFYPIQYDPTTKFVEVDVTLAKLSPRNRLVTVHSQVSRKEANGEESVKLSISLSSSFNKNYINMKYIEPVNIEETVTFRGSDKLSSSFLVFNKTVDNFDLVTIRLNIEADYQNIDGFNFKWTSLNPNAGRFIGFAKISSAFFIIYILVFFIPLIKFEIEPFTQKFVLFLMICALLSSIPVTLFNFDNISAFYEFASLSIFVTVLRIFSVTQIQIPQSQYLKPDKNKTLIISFVLGISTLVDVFARYSRYLIQDKPIEFQFFISNIEKLNILFNLIISICLLIYGVLSHNSNSRRSFLFSSFLILLAIVELATEVLAPILKLNVVNIWPPMIFIAFNTVSAIFLAFLFHPAEDLQYQGVGRADNGNSLQIEDAQDPGNLFDDDEN